MLYLQGMKLKQLPAYQKKILFAFLIIILAMVVYSSLISQSNDKSVASKSGLKESLEINYDYKHAKIRLPYNLLFGELSYSEWLRKEKANLLSVLKIPTKILPKPKWHKTNNFKKDNIEITTYMLKYPKGIISDHGFFLARPTLKKIKGLVVAIHGHEEPYRGNLPEKMLDDNHWSTQFIDSGYIVLIPSHVFYESIKQLVNNQAHHYVWTRFISDSLEIAVKELNKFIPVYAAGVSSGCTTAMLLAIIEERIKAFSGGGCTAPLSFLRQFYRIPNHPNQWDLPEFEDELPVLALGAHKHFQFQIGEKDILFPDGEEWITSSGETITQRDILVSELAGIFLASKEIFRKASLGGQIVLTRHQFGHTLDPQKSIDFFKGK